jgi:NAD(P)H-hydrate epimerase
MGAADRRAIEAGTPVEVLMDRAGKAVAWSIRRRLDRAAGIRAVIVCGKGNNGGDGLVVARVLRGWGARVDVFRVGDGIDAAALTRAITRADIVVDAMYGTGFRGELTGDARAVCGAFAEFDGPVVAIDIPSGVDGLTGAVQGVAVRADWTVSFAAAKPGTCFEPGRSLAGDVEVVDIGIAVGETGAQVRTFVTDAGDVAGWVPRRLATAHKWSAGVYVVGGSGGMTGAPTLASHAAMRAGAGIVWCGVPGADAAARASGTEVITKALPADREGALTADAADAVLAAADRFRAVALGPGLGRADGTVAAVRRLVADLVVPLVVDADALHALGGHQEVLRARAIPAVLTPHAGEFAAVRGEAPGPDRLAAARALAADTGAVVLLKGPGTVVADPGGRATICPLGGPWLASAGTGDVLTGITAALLARGIRPFEAAAAAAFVHGRAADLAGHTGLVAGDLVDALPLALEALDGGRA